MAHVRHGAPRMQGETNEGWCIRYTGTSSSDTESFPSVKFYGLLFCVVRQDEILSPRNILLGINTGSLLCYSAFRSCQVRHRPANPIAWALRCELDGKEDSLM